jgi:hypothetical protein
MSATITVPGEDLPPAFRFVVLVVGLSSAAGSAHAWTTVSGARLERAGRASAADAGPATSTPLPSSTGARAIAPAAPSSAAAPGVVGAAPPPTPCPPLVVELKMGAVVPPEAARVALEGLARWLVEHDTVTVVVDGHADASGSDDANLRLSRTRATLVGVALERAGVAKSRITTRGFGAFWPMDEAPPDPSWNRRVVIQTKGATCPRDQVEVIAP